MQPRAVRGGGLFLTSVEGYDDVVPVEGRGGEGRCVGVSCDVWEEKG